MHRETHLDASFGRYFRGVAVDARKITDELMQWLKDARARPHLTDEERAWKELRIYYFHNCIYGRVYPTEQLQNPLSIGDLIRLDGTALQAGPGG